MEQRAATAEPVNTGLVALAAVVVRKVTLSTLRVNAAKAPTAFSRCVHWDKARIRTLASASIAAPARQVSRSTPANVAMAARVCRRSVPPECLTRSPVLVRRFSPPARLKLLASSATQEEVHRRLGDATLTALALEPHRASAERHLDAPRAVPMATGVSNAARVRMVKRRIMVSASTR